MASACTYTRIRRGGARKATYACLVWDCEIVGWATTTPLLFALSACATRAMIGFEKEDSCSKVTMYRAIDHRGHARVLIHV